MTTRNQTTPIRRLLVTSDPSGSERLNVDVPEIYRRLAADGRFEVFHCNPAWIDDASDTEVPTVSVSSRFDVADFVELATQTAARRQLTDFAAGLCFHASPESDVHARRLDSISRQLRFLHSPRNVLAATRPDGADGMFVVTNDFETAIDYFRDHPALVAFPARSDDGRRVARVWLENGLPTLRMRSHRPLVFADPAEAFVRLVDVFGSSLRLVRTYGEREPIRQRLVMVGGNPVHTHADQIVDGAAVDLAACPTADEDRSHPHPTSGVLIQGVDRMPDANGKWTPISVDAGRFGELSRIAAGHRPDLWTELADAIARRLDEATCGSGSTRDNHG